MKLPAVLKDMALTILPNEVIQNGHDKSVKAITEGVQRFPVDELPQLLEIQTAEEGSGIKTTARAIRPHDHEELVQILYDAGKELARTHTVPMIVTLISEALVKEAATEEEAREAAKQSMQDKEGNPLNGADSEVVVASVTIDGRVALSILHPVRDSKGNVNDLTMKKTVEYGKSSGGLGITEYVFKGFFENK